MLKAVHFGAGNIGRGFIGEILYKNNFSIGFIDINEKIIDELNNKKEYIIELADENQEKILVNNVYGINSKLQPEKVIEAISTADIITTAIGPNILPFIAELIAKGLDKRRMDNNLDNLDIIACENMIGGSSFLAVEVYKYLTEESKIYVDKYIGFPNAAVDRIVPIQSHEDPLYVSVEPFSEWVIDSTAIKNKELELLNVKYVENLEPYIERKLFSVNTGHATVAYLGYQKGYKTILDAITDEEIVKNVKSVLSETGNLIINKWDFEEEEHQQYIDKIIKRFKNPYISDDISRVARTPIRKLGYNERFIRPIRELKEYNLKYNELIYVVGVILKYNDSDDVQSTELKTMISNNNLEDVIANITELDDSSLVEEIVESYNS